MKYKVDITDEEIEDLFIQLRFARSFLVNAMGLIPEANSRIEKYYVTNRNLEDKLWTVILCGRAEQEKSTEQHDSEDNK